MKLRLKGLLVLKTIKVIDMKNQNKEKFCKRCQQNTPHHTKGGTLNGHNFCLVCGIYNK
tara:strand:+ start:131 stop:307 length:177 start_codon:yes stop_codon:yes gene_type:complete